MRRCRPLLGTFVEIEVSTASDPALAEDMLRAGFDAIQRVQEKLSFHDPESDLSRLNLSPVGRWVGIGEELETVLRFSLDLERRSDGVFNVAVGSTLAGWGLLPIFSTINSGLRQRTAAIGSGSFELRPGMGRRLLPNALDLGGVAKGFAVDQAVQAICERDPHATGIVNAGGDLRCFGKKEFGLYLRDGAIESSFVRPVLLKNGSAATSSVRKQLSQFGQVSFHVDPVQGLPVLREMTCTIFAQDCMVADALTKTALILKSGSKLHRLADSYGAQVSWA
jgi:thiamine biosynthesis lipoprotein